MTEIFREFFGIGGYQRAAEGYFSWQHLTFVSALMVLMIAAAIYFGLRSRRKPLNQRNRALVWAAILIDGLELFKIILGCIENQNPMEWVYLLPLFLCSIQLITIPLAAFSRGRMKEAAMDFVCIFGVLGAVMGTYFAGNNYAAYPVLSFTNVVSGITHCISGFTALYIFIAGMTGMKKENRPIVCGIMLGFAVAAYVANIFTDCNYMFLTRGDGTPYDILYNLVGGHKLLYPVGVVGLFLVYIFLFYWVYHLIAKKKKAAVAA